MSPKPNPVKVQKSPSEIGEEFEDYWRNLDFSVYMQLSQVDKANLIPKWLLDHHYPNTIETVLYCSNAILKVMQESMTGSTPTKKSTKKTTKSTFTVEKD